MISTLQKIQKNISCRFKTYLPDSILANPASSPIAQETMELEVLSSPLSSPYQDLNLLIFLKLSQTTIKNSKWLKIKYSFIMILANLKIIAHVVFLKITFLLIVIFVIIYLIMKKLLNNIFIHIFNQDNNFKENN